MNARLDRPSVQLLSSEEVVQHTTGAHTVRLRKERLRVDDRVALVRKHRPAGPPGPKVVLVHGFAQNRYTWHGSRRSISAWLADAGFDVYNLDLPGHGDSRGGGSPERFADYVADVARVAGALGEPAFWVGHSLGGAVIYASATTVPMRGVVGIGALFRFAQANAALKALCAVSDRLRGGPLGALNVRTRLAGKVLSRLYAVSDIAGYAFPMSGWAPGSIEEDVLAERLERGFDWTSANVWFEMSRWSASGRFDYEEAWGRTNVPLLVIAGDLDHCMLPKDARTAFDASGSADRTFVTMDDWTTGHHWGHIDLITGRHAPRHTWPLIRDWLAAR